MHNACWGAGPFQKLLELELLTFSPQMESHLGPLCGAETQIDGEGTLHRGVGGRGKSSTGLRELQVVLSLQEAEGASVQPA